MAIKKVPRLTPRAMGMWAGYTGKMDVFKGAMDTMKRMGPPKKMQPELKKVKRSY